MGEQGTLFDRFYGCLISGAIGDAMGAPTEDWHYEDIRRDFGPIDRFLPQPARKRDGRPGQITDDTTLRHYLCLAIIRKRGRITPDDYARVWLDDLNPDRLFVTEAIVLKKLQLGMSPWDSGRGQPLADAAIMAVAPVGLINAGDPCQAYQDGYVLSGIHQDGLERDAAATMAAAFAAAFLPGATATTMLDAAAALASFDARRLLSIGRDLAARTGSVEAFVEAFYLRYLDRSFPRPASVVWDAERTVSPTSREVLPIVAGLFQLCDGDPVAAISAGASIGRDADTICTLLGGLGGALRGAGAIRADWIEQSEAANRGFFAEMGERSPPDFRATAEAMVDALAGERERVRSRLGSLDAMLTDIDED